MIPRRGGRPEAASFLAMCLYGYVALWLCSYVAMWLYGCVAMLLCAYVAILNFVPLAWSEDLLGIWTFLTFWNFDIYETLTYSFTNL